MICFAIIGDENIRPAVPGQIRAKDAQTFPRRGNPRLLPNIGEGAVMVVMVKRRPDT